MADIFPASDSVELGVWQTIEQAAVALGLSVRTVNRHISAQKLKSRLMEGRREVFVASPAPPETIIDTATPTADLGGEDFKSGDGRAAALGTLGNDETTSSNQKGQARVVNSTLDFETALARADNAADKAELAVSAYQSLARSIETQAQVARKMATTAWCIVAFLMMGVTVAVGWTATRLTRSEAEAQHLKEDADAAGKRAEAELELAAKDTAKHEQYLAELRQQLSLAQQQASAAGERASRAEGKAEILEQMQFRQPLTRPTSGPTLIDRLTTAFGGGANH